MRPTARVVPVFLLTVAWSFALVSSLRAGELPIAKPADVGMSAARLRGVDKAMDRLVGDGKIAGGVVAIARRGQVVLLKAYGKADLEADKPMATDTIFRIYSMTKAITSAAALTAGGKSLVVSLIPDHLPCFRRAVARRFAEHTPKCQPSPIPGMCGDSPGWLRYPLPS